MKTVSYYYFEDLPILEITPPGIAKNDSRLNDKDSFKHKFDSWSALYKKDIFTEIKEHGVIDPLIGLYENNRWRIEPGQARWLAMWYMNYTTQRVVCMVRDCDDFDYFLRFKHKLITAEEVYSLFIDSRDKPYVGYNYIKHRADRYLRG